MSPSRRVRSSELTAAPADPSQLPFQPSSRSVYVRCRRGKIGHCCSGDTSWYLLFRKKKRKEKKQRLSNRSKPLTRTCLIGSGWFTRFIDLKVAFIFRDPPPLRPLPHASPGYHRIFLFTTGWLFATFLSSSVVIFYAQMVFFRSGVRGPCWHPLLTPFFFACLPTCYQHLFPLPLPWRLPPWLARSGVTDQNPLLSAYRLHLALIV